MPQSPSQALAITHPDMKEREREKNMLVGLRARYVPVKNLRKKHKDLIKTIKSLEQGRNGLEVACVFCKFVAQNDKMQLNHINKNRYDNRLENLEPCDQECNNAAHKAAHSDHLVLSDPSCVCVRESNEARRPNERTVTREAMQWQSKEGVKHDTQRKAWDLWIRDTDKGPFKGVNTTLYVAALAEMAPWGISRHIGLDGPLGSSVTYRRFINEDIKGQILSQDEDNLGKHIVYLNLARIKQEKEGQ